jgi:hypothetical protein
LDHFSIAEADHFCIVGNNIKPLRVLLEEGKVRWGGSLDLNFI